MPILKKLKTRSLLKELVSLSKNKIFFLLPFKPIQPLSQIRPLFITKKREKPLLQSVLSTLKSARTSEKEAEQMLQFLKQSLSRQVPL